MFIFSTLKMYWNLGNFEGLVLILGPWDGSGPDRLQTLMKTRRLDVEAGEKSRSRVALRAASTASVASSRATRTTSLSAALSEAVSYLSRSSCPVGLAVATEGAETEL